MKKTILASVIFIGIVFGFEKCIARSETKVKSVFSPGCYGFFSIGANHDVLPYHDDSPSTVTINIDTTYDFGVSINDTLSYLEGGIHCLGCTSHIVTIYNDTGLFSDNFITCLNTNMTVIFHVMQSSSPLSVNETNNLNNLQIYPNPTANNFTIKNISSNQTLLLQIINPFGEIVYVEKLSGKKEYFIDAKIAKGIYFVQLGNIVRKLVVE